MSDLNISIPSDEEGFVLLQCNLCGEYFKMLTSDIKDESSVNIWCPYCGLNNDNYISEEVREIAIKKATNAVHELIFNSFKDLERKTRNDKGVTFKAGKKTVDEHISPIKVKINKLENKKYKCCNTIAKIKPLSIECGSYCPKCGGINYE